ncbi:unnamed protein product, partial [Amoebophrya sp. A25]
RTSSSSSSISVLAAMPSIVESTKQKKKQLIYSAGVAEIFGDNFEDPIQANTSSSSSTSLPQFNAQHFRRSAQAQAT